MTAAIFLLLPVSQPVEHDFANALYGLREVGPSMDKRRGPNGP